ncbi:hypothetical protein SDRG_10238 [Saprolegnia diclina VS20]|uniref:Uncharacterized protein n=1 Tax=Saprolegnia diclina (strain VS20) TaxID=1156394 RepID=T0Q2I6_SAPDV|nr:hypothetical protein SDRG_10238 [Saprolegnia diclina VS20]EQC32039.1 hypothetical protein SDRG_10238 [Saprolegnia diclina VS20]|eukprot:XP_008614441.1 hypothetical protein SDRG_10238 [Saprolegnia diclina VS20]
MSKRTKKRKGLAGTPTYEEMVKEHERRHGPIPPVDMPLFKRVVAAVDASGLSVRKRRTDLALCEGPDPKPYVDESCDCQGAHAQQNHDAYTEHWVENTAADWDVAGKSADAGYDGGGHDDEEPDEADGARHINDTTKPSIEMRKLHNDKRRANARGIAANAWRDLLVESVKDVADWATPLVRPGARCNTGTCTHPATYVCHTCKYFSTNAVFCYGHAVDHAPYAHNIVDAKGCPILRPALRSVPCLCGTTRSARAKPMEVLLHGYDGSEKVQVLCSACKPASVLLRLGFFPSSPTVPAKGFAFSMLQSACAYRRANVSVFGAAKVFFGEHPDYEHDVHGTIYPSFNAAIGEFSRIQHLL